MLGKNWHFLIWSYCLVLAVPDHVCERPLSDTYITSCTFDNVNSLLQYFATAADAHVKNSGTENEGRLANNMSKIYQLWCSTFNQPISMHEM